MIIVLAAFVSVLAHDIVDIVQVQLSPEIPAPELIHEVVNAAMERVGRSSDRRRGIDNHSVSAMAREAAHAVVDAATRPLSKAKEAVTRIFHNPFSGESGGSFFVDTQGSRFYFLHIPKTAGESFLADCQDLLPDCSMHRLDPDQGAVTFREDVEARSSNPIDIDTNEGCFPQSQTRAASLSHWLHGRAGKMNRNVGVFLRDPVDHIISQYYHCSQTSDHADRREYMPDTLETWVEDWTSMERDSKCIPKPGGNGPNRPCDDPRFRCYYPWDLQTHHLTCSNMFVHSAAPDQARALENIHSARFVGMVEAYQESFCLFAALSMGVEHLPAYCDCNGEEWSSFHSTNGANHSFTHPSRNVLSQRTHALIENLTAIDSVVYEAGRARFLDDVAELERLSGKTILCEQARNKLMKWSGTINKTAKSSRKGSSR